MKNVRALLGLILVASLATTAACRGSDGDDDNQPDGGGGGGDGGGGDGGGGGGDTIYDVQDPARNMPEGTVVNLEGVLVTAVDSYGGRVGGLYIQEPDGGAYSGVLVFNAQGVENVQPGDLVNVTGGAKQEFALATDESGRKLTELSPPDGGTITVTKVGTGTLPTPPVVDPLTLASDDAEAEKWEGVPVTFTDVSIVGGLRGATMSDPTLMEFRVSGPFRVDSSLMLLPAESIEVGGCIASITGIVDYFFNYKLLPRNTADITFNGDGCSLATTTISEIQMGNATGAVSLTNVIVTAKGGDAATPKIWLADSATAAPSEGIYVFAPTLSGVTFAELAVGDTVNMPAGTVVEYFDLTEIEGGATLTKVATAPVTVTPAAAALAALAVAATAEPFEGVLVRLTNVSVSNADAGFGTWTLGTENFVVDDVLVAKPGDLAAGDCYTVTGVLDYSFGAFKLYPRSAEDMVKNAPGDCL